MFRAFLLAIVYNSEKFGECFEKRVNYLYWFIFIFSNWYAF